MLIFNRRRGRLETAVMLGLEMRFPVPVRPGDELTRRQICVEKRRSKSRPGLGIVKSRTALSNAAGDEVMVMVSNFLVEVRA